MEEVHTTLNSATTAGSQNARECSSQACPAPGQFRVLLWCTPRSTSSIITKCLSFVPGTQVFFEPYYFCYEALARLKELGKVGEEEIAPEVGMGMEESYGGVAAEDWRLATKMISGEDCGERVDYDKMKYHRIKELLDKPDPNRKGIFLKEVAYTIDGHYDFLPDKSSGYRHAFLLRHPIKVFASWRKVMLEIDQEVNGSTVSRTDCKSFHMIKDLPGLYSPPGLFFKELYDLWSYVKANLDPNPVIVDSDDLLSDPPTVLSRFCSAVGMPYTDGLLKWDGNPDTTSDWITAFSPPNDFEFIRIYCKNAFSTTNFLPPSPIPDLESLTQDVKECVEASMPYYQAMYENRI